MLAIRRDKSFKKDYKKSLKRGNNQEDFVKVLNFLVNEQPLPEKYRDHKLRDAKEYSNVRECHINPDWLLIYRIEKEVEILRLIRTGSHSDLF